MARTYPLEKYRKKPKSDWATSITIIRCESCGKSVLSNGSFCPNIGMNWKCQEYITTLGCPIGSSVSSRIVHYDK